MAKSAPKPDDSSRDFELMALVKAGIDHHFREIVERHQQGLLNFFRKLGVFADAEDLVQDTFVRIYKYRDRYEPKARFTTFLYMIARQVRLDYLRKVQRRSEVELEGDGEVNLEHAAGEEGGRNRLPDAEGLLRALDDDVRELIVLSIYKGMTYPEISEIAGVPVGTIKSRVFTAMRKMRAMLESGGSA